MRRTGTSHPVAISGLHIGFVAGLAGWLIGALWRRSFLIGRGLPLRLPAQKVVVASGALFAAFHAALAGFNVPAQRALWMAGVVALAYAGGRRLGSGQAVRCEALCPRLALVDRRHGRTHAQRRARAVRGDHRACAVDDLLLLADTVDRSGRECIRNSVGQCPRDMPWSRVSRCPRRSMLSLSVSRINYWSGLLLCRKNNDFRQHLTHN
jgi:hypothetical protein